MIKWDPRGHLLASSAKDDSRLLIWTPKSSEPLIVLNDHDDAVCEFQWSHVDSSSLSSNLSQSGVGFIVTLSIDCTVRVFNIAAQNSECVLSLKHENQLLSMALSPDNQLLAVGGHNADICLWSLKDKKLLKSFQSSSSQ